MLKYLLNFFKSRTQLQLENIFLRKQLEILNRGSKKVRIKSWDKIFFSTIISFFNNWKESMIIVKPETIIRWHRKRFYQHLLRKNEKDAGRPRVPGEIIDPIKQIARENPMWGIPRIHGEIKKLRYHVSQATVWRYVPKKDGSTNGQRWKTFLKNHASGIISINFFYVPTINFRLLHVLAFLSDEWRRIIYPNATAHPISVLPCSSLRKCLLIL